VTPPATNYAEWKFYIDIVVMILVAGNAGYTWWSNREKVTSQRFEALEKDVQNRLKKDDLDDAKSNRDKQCVEHKRQTAGLEKVVADLHIEVTRLPTRAEITALDLTMKSLAEKIGNLDGRLTGVNRAVDLMNEFLIDQGGKK
jgi:hypothetical protein